MAPVILSGYLTPVTVQWPKALKQKKHDPKMASFHPSRPVFHIKKHVSKLVSSRHPKPEADISHQVQFPSDSAPPSLEGTQIPSFQTKAHT